MDPRNPVLVGVGIASQHIEDPTAAAPAGELMRRALDAAIADSGAPQVADRIDEVLVPEGIWDYRDPARLALDGRSPQAHTVVADIGVLQQTLFGRAAERIRRGDAEVVVIAAGEAKYRQLRGQILGIELDEVSAPTEPDSRLRPAADILPEIEINRGLAAPTHQYAVMESTLRANAGRSPAQHARDIAETVSRLSQIAEANPNAWRREPMTAEEILGATLVAEPYTKPCCSQWNVDQASAFVMCSAGTARSMGVPTDRWIHPLASAESNLMVPLSARAEPHRSPAVAAVGDALVATIGCPLNSLDIIELYSCFPAAIGIQRAELRIDTSRDISATGGMHFAGGPLNSFSLQALASIVPRLRAHPDQTAVVTSVSGMLTKFGAGVWSATPGLTPFRSVDVTESARRATATRPIDPDADGPARVVGYTVGHLGGKPYEAVVVAETPDGRRTVAASQDSDTVEAMRVGEWCGRTIHIDSADFSVP